jgi:hypothetical protein
MTSAGSGKRPSTRFLSQTVAPSATTMKSPLPPSTSSTRASGRAARMAAARLTALGL